MADNNDPFASLNSAIALNRGSEGTTLEIPKEVSATVTPDNEEGHDFLDYVVDIPKGVVRGAGQAVNATLDLGASALDFGQEIIDKGWEAASFDEVESSIRIPEQYLPDVDTVAGELATSISQFAVEFAGVGKVMPFLKVAKGAGTMARISKNAAQGFVADFAGFKATEANLSQTLLETFPQIESEYLEWMANDGSDPHIEGRLKNAIEGLGLGVATDMVMDGLRAMRAVKKAPTAEAAREAAEKHLDTDWNKTAETGLADVLVKGAEIEEVTQESVTTVKEALEQGKAVPKRLFETPEQVKTQLEKLARKDINWGDMDSDTVLQLQEAVAKDPHKYYADLNKDPGFGKFIFDSEEGKRMFVAVTEAMADKLDKATPLTFEKMTKEALKDAADHGMERNYPIHLISSLMDGMDGNRKAYIASLQVRTLLGAQSTRIHELAKKLNSGVNVSIQDKYEFALLHKQMQTLWMYDRNYRTSTARSLASFKNNVAPVEMAARIGGKDGPVDLTAIFDKRMNLTDEEVTKFLEAHDITEKSIDAVAEAVLKCGGNPDRMFGVIKALNAGTWTRQFNFWFTQNILTGPVTHAFNLMGNVSKTAFIAADRMAGSIVRAPFRGSLDEVVDSWHYTQGLVFYLTDAFRASLKTLMTSTGTSGLRTQMNSNASKYGVNGVSQEYLPTSYQSVKNLMLAKDPDGVLTAEQQFYAGMLHVGGWLARMNARSMAAEDEFFRQLNFMAAKRELIMRKLSDLQISKSKEPDRWKETYEKLDKQFFTENGLVNTKNPDAAEALRLADTSTFAQELKSPMIRGVQNLTNKSMFAKAVLPFVKTVWNVTEDAVEHTPGLSYFSKDFREAVKAGGARGQEALGKIVTGTLVVGLTFNYAEQGLIVGELSSNKKEREVQERQGMKPYSIKIGDKWYQYQRLDPLGALLGIVANTNYYMSNSKDMADDKKVDTFFKIAGSLTSTIAEKSFLTGLNDLMDMLFAGDKSAEALAKWSGNFVNSLMPASGLARQLYNEYDRDIQRTPNTFLGIVGEGPLIKPIKRMLNSSGVQAKEAPVKFDWLTGETPQRPFLGFISDHNDYWVLSELSKLANSFSSAPTEKIGEVSLTQEQYSRYCELHGTLKINGKTLMEALEDTMKSFAYDFDRERWADEDPEQDRTRRGDLLRREVTKYREAAKKRLLEEIPKLAEAVANKKYEKKKMRAGQRLSTALN